MRSHRDWASVVLLLASLALMAGAAGATTVIREGLEALTAGNEIIVHGRVLELHSYWNSDHTFILTDARVRPSEVLKGDGAGGDVALTLAGGTVADTTILIVGGPELVPGSEYLLFLGHVNLPGAPRTLSVRDLSQSVFEVRDGAEGRRAISQASRQPLLPDAGGRRDAPGGDSGSALDDLLQQIRDLVHRR